MGRPQSYQNPRCHSTRAGNLDSSYLSPRMARTGWEQARARTEGWPRADVAAARMHGSLRSATRLRWRLGIAILPLPEFFGNGSISCGSSQHHYPTDCRGKTAHIARDDWLTRSPALYG